MASLLSFGGGRAPTLRSSGEKGGRYKGERHDG